MIEAQTGAFDSEYDSVTPDNAVINADVLSVRSREAFARGFGGRAKRELSFGHANNAAHLACVAAHHARRVAGAYGRVTKLSVRGESDRCCSCTPYVI